MAILHDDFVAEGSTLSDNDLHFFAGEIGSFGGGFKIAVQFGRGDDASAFFVDVDVDEVELALLHRWHLLAEGTEEVFDESPVEERAIFVHPSHSEKGEVADTGERCFKGADQTLRLVQIDKDVDFVAFVNFRGEIFFGKEDFSEVTSVKIGSVSGEAVDA